MPTYGAFLRAINVGKRRVSMADLRRHFEAMGFVEVGTLIASGNVRFASAQRSAAKIEAAIERGLADALGFHSDAFVRSAAELDAVLSRRPFGATPAGVTEHIAFLKAPAPGLAVALRAHETKDDAFHVEGREMHWRRVGRMSDGEFSGAVLERLLGGPATFRKRETVEKMVG